MKHRFFALSVLALSLSLTSCLDETPKDQIPETEIYDSANSLYVNAVASLYNYIGAHEEGEGLQGTCRGIYDYNTLTTDEAIIPIRGGNWYDGGLWENMYDHTWTATDTDLYNIWKYLYKVIVLSTKSLETIEKHKALLTEQPSAPCIIIMPWTCSDAYPSYNRQHKRRQTSDRATEAMCSGMW